MVSACRWLLLFGLSAVIAADEPTPETLPDEDMLLFLAETDVQMIVNAELAELLALVELYQPNTAAKTMEQTDE